MKKSLVLICIFALILQSFSFTYANKYLEIDVVEMVDAYDGTTGEYKVVNMMINGDDVFADVPSILYVKEGKTRTLVPISFITEKIGAEIKWNSATQEATIKHDGNTIVLQIDNSVATVNGEKVSLPNNIAPKLMAYEGSYRTMVPVNFISTHLGYEIFWIGATRTVSINKPEQSLTAVRYNNTGLYPELRFKVSGEVSVTSYSIDGESVGGKNTIVMEFHNTELDIPNLPAEGKYYINDMIEEVYRVQVQQSDDSVKTVKAVVDLGYFRNGDVYYDASTKEMVVQMINSVKYVDVEKINQATAVVIESNEVPAYDVDIKTDRVIIDVMNSKLSNENGTFAVNQAGIKSVTYEDDQYDSKYDADMRFTRVTVILEDGMSAENVYVDDDGQSKVFVFVQDSIFSTYSYARFIDQGASQFGLNFLSPAKYPVTYTASSRTVSLQVPTSNINLLEGLDKRDDGVIDEISVVKSGDFFNISLKMAENTTYMATETTTSNFRITFANEVLKNSDYKDKLIVIDAGHGGHDPGAISGSIYEKDIALEAALILKRELENAGFKVYMTRERDNYVKLYDRAGIANQLDADMFISIHINAAKSTSARGMEVLYDPDSKRNNYALAKEIQSELIKATGAYDRGVISRPDLVVTRETAMDAVLVELGFISNEADRSNLLRTSYLEKSAEAILQGIIDFMD